MNWRVWMLVVNGSVVVVLKAVVVVLTMEVGKLGDPDQKRPTLYIDATVHAT